MDAAELHEFPSFANLNDPQSQAVALSLGGPVSPQYALNPALRSPTAVATNLYRPPPGVLYQLVHSPSQVPFNRLPPAYLTTLRGCVYPPTRQRQQIPGRGGNYLQPTDLMPTLTIDEGKLSWLCNLYDDRRQTISA